MSFLDPARAKAELGFRHEPLGSYLDKIVTSFLAHPPADRRRATNREPPRKIAGCARAPRRPASR